MKIAQNMEKNNNGSHFKQLILVCFITMLYALCYQIQSPLEPFLVEKLVKDQNSGTDNKTSYGETYAKLRSFFSVAQWFGSLSFGYLLDRWGVKTGYFINFIACALCYYLLSISTTVQLLYLSKIPGVAMAGYLCAQTAVVKITNPGIQRIKWLGIITTAYTIGGTIGPYVGGILGSKGDYYTSATYASVGSILCFFLIFMLPNSLSNKPAPIAESQMAEQQRPIPWIRKVSKIFSICGYLLFIKLVSCMVNSMARSTQPLILKDFGVMQQTMGKILSLQFAFGGFTNAFLISPITTFLGGKSQKVIEKALFLMATVYILQFIFFAYLNVQGYRIEFMVMNVLSLALVQYTLAVSSTSRNSALVPKQMQGTLLGIQSSIFAVGFMIGPQLGVKIWQQYGLTKLSLACAAIYGLCALSGLFFLKSPKNQKIKQQ